MRVMTWTVAVFLVAGWAGAASGSPQHSVASTPSEAASDAHASKVASARYLFPARESGPALVPTSARQRGFGRKAPVSGTVGGDRISGSVWRDVIVTGGGSDVVRDVSRNDLVCTGAGDATVRSDHSQWGSIDLGSGDDRLEVAVAGRVFGGPGDDRLQVHGEASVDAGGGDDVLVSAAGGHLEGGGGDDRIVVDHGGGEFSGGPGQDYVAVRKHRSGAISGEWQCLSYRSSSTPIQADLETGWVRGQGRDRAENFSCLIGSRFDDEISGTSGPDEIAVLQAQTWWRPMRGTTASTAATARTASTWVPVTTA